MSTTIITRLYTDRGRAASVAKELGLMGFRSSAVHVIDAAGGDAGRLAQQLVGLQATRAAATAYANEAVRTGGTLVVVEAPWGRAAVAMSKLNDHCGIAIDADDAYLDSLGRPVFSDAIGIPTLSKNPAPLSDFIGMPVLMESESSTQLSKNPAPLSSMIGFPTLSEGFVGKNSSFGIPLLSAGFEGKSSSFGLPLLMKNPAPLSSMFGLPTLTGQSDR